MDDWVTVHAGPVWQAEIFRGLLSEHGIDVFLPDSTTKIMDPFATGALPLHTQLQVRACDVQEARQVLAEIAAEAEDGADLDAIALSTPPDPSLGVSVAEAAAKDVSAAPGSVRERARCAIERLAARTRWAALLWITFPWAIGCGFRYVGASRRRGIRSTKHRLTLAALCLGLLTPVLTVLFWILLASAIPVHSAVHG